MVSYPGVTGLVVVVESRSNTFEQFALALRRRGVQVVWAMPVRGWRTATYRRLAVGDVHAFATASDLAGVLRRLGPERVLDVVADEMQAGLVAEASRTAGLSTELQAVLERRLEWTDKWWTSSCLLGAGIPVPPTLPGDTPPALAVERLGLPLVVKTRRGSGGTGVRVVHTSDELTRLTDAEAAAGSEIYLEKYLTGGNVQYSAAFLPGGEVVQSILVRGRRLPSNSFGPVDGIETFSSPDVDGIGQRVLGLVDSRGLANIELIEHEGDWWVHDVNLRPWGNIMAARSAGVEFLDGYLATLGDPGARRMARSAASPASGQVLWVWPTAALSRAGESLGRALVALTRDARPLRKDVGLRYLGVSILGGTAYLLRNRRTARAVIPRPRRPRRRR